VASAPGETVTCPSHKRHARPFIWLAYHHRIAIKEFLHAIQAPGFVRRNAAAAIGTAHAATEIQWWHSMTAVNNEWVNDLAKQFNESQKDYKVVPTFKGVYDESMTAAIAAFRSGNAPTSCRCLKWAPPP
jgi:hypothetical protein